MLFHFIAIISFPPSISRHLPKQMHEMQKTEQIDKKIKFPFKSWLLPFLFILQRSLAVMANSGRCTRVHMHTQTRMYGVGSALSKHPPTMENSPWLCWGPLAWIKSVAQFESHTDNLCHGNSFVYICTQSPRINAPSRCTLATKTRQMHINSL